MPDPRQYVRPGQRLQIAASQINALNEMMRKGDAATFVPTRPKSAPYTAVYAKNISGSTAARWGVFAITGMEIAPTAGSGEKQFEEMPVVKIVATPNQSLFRCVAIEPIADGKIGRVAVEGVVQLRLENLSKATGARVLWKGDEGWALVALNCGFLLCKTTAAWEKNTAATLQIWNDVSQSQLGMDGLIESQSSGETVRGYNKYANIPANRFCSLALHPNGRWYVVAAEC